MACEEDLAAAHAALVAIRDLAKPVVQIVLDPDPAANNRESLRTQLAAIPPGSRVQWPAGVYEFGGWEHQFYRVNIVGLQDVTFLAPPVGECVLHWNDNGPKHNSRWQCRYFRLADCTNVKFGGFRLVGAWENTHPLLPDVAEYDPLYELQHGVWLLRSHQMTINMEVEKVSGDGLYIQTCDDLFVERLIVNRNGRQGIAGFSGNRWVFGPDVDVVWGARSGIDLEPQGTHWVDDVTVDGGHYFGRKGSITIHQASGVTVNGTRTKGRLRLSDANQRLLDSRTVELVGVDFADGGPGGMPQVSAGAFKSFTVTGCRAEAVAGGPLIRLADSALVGATITVTGNTAIGCTTALGHSLTEQELDVMVPSNTWDVGGNDLGSGNIEGVPDWIASRL